MQPCRWVSLHSATFNNHVYFTVGGNYCRIIAHMAVICLCDRDGDTDFGNDETRRTKRGINEHNSNNMIKVFSYVISGARLARQLFGSVNDCLLWLTNWVTRVVHDIITGHTSDDVKPHAMRYSVQRFSGDLHFSFIFKDLTSNTVRNVSKTERKFQTLRKMWWSYWNMTPCS